MPEDDQLKVAVEELVPVDANPETGKQVGDSQESVKPFAGSTVFL